MQRRSNNLTPITQMTIGALKEVGESQNKNWLSRSGTKAQSSLPPPTANGLRVRKRRQLILSLTVALIAGLLLAMPAPTTTVEKYPVQINNEVQQIPSMAIELPQLQQELAPVAVEAKPSNMSHYEMLRAAGVAESDFAAADFIIMHEGHYNPCVINGGAVDCNYATNGGQKAYGVCQAMPGVKMASAGADWATNPITQIRWCSQYAQRYGGWQGSYQAWLRQNWW